MENVLVNHKNDECQNPLMAGKSNEVYTLDTGGQKNGDWKTD